MKQCKKCGKEIEINKLCDECKIINRKESQKRYGKKYRSRPEFKKPEQIGELSVNEYNFKYWQKRRYKRYGITEQEYQKLKDECNGVCPLCGIKIRFFEDKKGDSAQLDHSHLSGRVRGFLCASCNRGLGQFKDNIETLEKAILWLKTK